MANIQAIPAVRAVHFVRTRTHITLTQASITVVTGIGLENTEYGNLAYQFHGPADRTNKPTPEIRNNER